MNIIEVWRNPDGVHWLAEHHTEKSHQFSNWAACQAYYRKDGWPYWYLFNGKTATAIVVSKECFTRGECMEIAGLIIAGKGVKAWAINLSEPQTLTP